MAVKRTAFLGIRSDRWEYQQLLERCNGRQLAGVDGKPVSIRARRGRCGAVHRSVLLRQLAGMGEQPQPNRPKNNGGQWSGADRSSGGGRADGH